MRRSHCLKLLPIPFTAKMTARAHDMRRIAVQITITKRKATEEEEQQRETKLRHLMAELEDPAPATQPDSEQPSQPEPAAEDTAAPEAAPRIDADPAESDEDPLFDDEESLSD